MVLPIRVNSTNAEPGDLHAEVRDGALWIPALVASEASTRGLRSAADLISFATTFPTALAGRLNWTVPEVLSAVKKLAEQLEKYDPAFRQFSVHMMPAYAFGARDPGELSHAAALSSPPKRGNH